MSGVGMVAEVLVNEDLAVAVMLTAERDGEPSANELAAERLLDEQPANGTREMTATMLERLAKLVPVICADCGEEKDVTAIVASLRRGAVLS